MNLLIGNLSNNPYLTYEVEDSGTVSVFFKSPDNLIENRVLICSIQADDGEYFKQIRFNGLEDDYPFCPEVKVSEEFVSFGNKVIQKEKGLV
tara:strand:+ start:726 stop:1001 length:276 start_codon:yes stop_codon:yes gene_type:complete